MRQECEKIRSHISDLGPINPHCCGGVHTCGCQGRLLSSWRNNKDLKRQSSSLFRGDQGRLRRRAKAVHGDLPIR